MYRRGRKSKTNPPEQTALLKKDKGGDEEKGKGGAGRRGGGPGHGRRLIDLELTRSGGVCNSICNLK